MSRRSREKNARHLVKDFYIEVLDLVRAIFSTNKVFRHIFPTNIFPIYLWEQSHSHLEFSPSSPKQGLKMYND